LSSSAPSQAADRPSRPDPIGAQTSWSILVVAMLLLIVPIVTLSQLAAHNRIDVVDDQMFGYFGWRIAHGGVVYEDIWDNKPPGIYWMNALGFLIGRGLGPLVHDPNASGWVCAVPEYAGVVMLCSLAVGVALACFFIICASVYFRGAAAVATVFAAFFLTHGFFQGGTNRTETFLMAFELAAVALYFRGFAADRWWKWFLAGVCGGCAFLLKQVGLAAWATLGVHLIILVIARDLSWRVGLRRCLLLLGGLVAVVAVATLVIVVQGAAGHAFFAIFGFNRAYFTAGKSSFTETGLNDLMLREHIEIALLLPLLMTAASLIHAFLWWIRPRFRPPEIQNQIRALRPVCPRYLLLFLIWYAIAYYGAVISPHHFRHYLLPTLPPLMLMSAYLINFLRGEISLTRRLQQRIWVTACFVAMGYFAIDALKWHGQELSKVWVYRFEEGKQAVWETVGDAAKKLSGPGDRIQCLGYMPGVYLRAQRLNASRYTTTEKLGQVSETREADIIRHEMKNELEATPPALMIMSTGDYDMIQEATAAALATSTAEYPDWLGLWLKEFLRDNYEQVLEIKEFNVLIFQRKDLQRPTTTVRAVGRPPAAARVAAATAASRGCPQPRPAPGPSTPSPMS
jgi:4-amino-4-deoxy-L-arabinose transferase-like glycosyltransferase